MQKVILVIFLLFIGSSTTCQIINKTDLKGTWIAKGDSLKYEIHFIDSSHLKFDSSVNVFDFNLYFSNGQNFFVIKNNNRDSAAVYFIVNQINKNKITLRAVKVRAFDIFKNTWEEKIVSDKDSKFQAWERKIK
jgi:hypothetical protein